MLEIVIVDYGVGNLYSVARAIQIADPKAKVRISNKPEDVIFSDRVILPGQGAIADCMLNLDKFGLRSAIMEASSTKPFLGICVGEQILFEKSEEQNTDGLGLFNGVVQKFSGKYFASLCAKSQLNHDRDAYINAISREFLKVPHMGWNKVNQRSAHPIWNGIPEGSYFYFVHSYYAVPEQLEHIIGETSYGLTFASAIARGNIVAVQFHPEKSANFGLRFYRNFLNWEP